MSGPYPEPDQVLGEGWLAVGDGQRIHWWTAGNPSGMPVLAVHGGPGSGCPVSWARFCDPDRFLVVGLDQRGCGASTPDAADPGVDLTENTTAHLIRDIETLREHLRIDRWMLLGASWGSTLALAYAQAHAQHVSGLVLFSVVTTSRAEIAWITRDIGRVFPEAWIRFQSGLPTARRSDPAAGYANLLADPDPAVRQAAADRWCEWEDTHVSLTRSGPDPRFADPTFRYRFARLVTHYWRNAGFLTEGQLLNGITLISHLPARLITGRADVSSPADVAWRLAQQWEAAELQVVSGMGHGADEASTELIVRGLHDVADATAGR